MLRVAIQLVLGALAAYHLAMGVLSVISLPATARAARTLYGVRLDDAPQLRHAVRMLGLYALAHGALLATAAVRPESSRTIIAVAAALQLARAAMRMGSGRELASAFMVTPTRNAAAIALLLLEGIALLTGLVFLSAP